MYKPIQSLLVIHQGLGLDLTAELLHAGQRNPSLLAPHPLPARWALTPSRSCCLQGTPAGTADAAGTGFLQASFSADFYTVFIVIYTREVKPLGSYITPPFSAMQLKK